MFAIYMSTAFDTTFQSNNFSLTVITLNAIIDGKGNITFSKTFEMNKFINIIDNDTKTISC